jgi:uncharacterized protein YdgA (DUF945 family)
MRKSVVAGAAIVVAVGAWAVAPLVSGLWVEQAFRDNLKALSGHPQVDLNLIAYERGWTEARAASELTLDTPEQSFTFRLDHAVEHGPTFSLPAIARIITRPQVPQDRAQIVAHYFGNRAPLKSEIRVGFTGTQHVTLSSPAFHGPLHTNEAIRVDWQGLSGEADVSADRDRVSLSLSAPGLDLSGEDATITLEALGMRSTMRKQAERLWFGDSHITLERLAMDVPDKAGDDRIRAEVRGLTGHQSVTPGDGEAVMRLSSDWGFEQAEVAGRSFSDGTLALSLSNIDRSAFRDLQERAADLQADDLAPEALNRENLALLQELAPRFLARSPKLAVSRLSLETQDGRLEGTADAAYRGDPDAKALPANPASMLQRVTAHARLTMDKALVTALLRTTAENKLAAKDDIDPDQAEEMAPRVAQMRLGMLQGMGILVAEDGKFSVEATWEEGSITVNGRPLGMGMGGGAPGMP